MTPKGGKTMNLIALKQKMLEKQRSNKDLSELLDISRSATQRKLSGESEFSRAEVKTLIEVLELSNEDVMLIFFN